MKTERFIKLAVFFLATSLLTSCVHTTKVVYRPAKVHVEKFPAAVTLNLTKEFTTYKHERMYEGDTFAIPFGPAFCAYAKYVSEGLFDSVEIISNAPAMSASQASKFILEPSVAKVDEQWGRRERKILVVIEWTVKDSKNGEVLLLFPAEAEALKSARDSQGEATDLLFTLTRNTINIFKSSAELRSRCGMPPIQETASAQKSTNGSAVPVSHSDDPLIEGLDPSNSSDTIRQALGKVVDKHSHDSTYASAIPAIKMLLADERPEVRRKAARTLGVLHADVNETDLNNIYSLLEAPGRDEVEDGLKALRGLAVPQAVPAIVPCLKHPETDVVVEACYTLGALGNKDAIPFLEALQKDSPSRVRRFARKAIASINSK